MVEKQPYLVFLSMLAFIDHINLFEHNKLFDVIKSLIVEHGRNG